jgi:Fe-S-cluster containining protein
MKPRALPIPRRVATMRYVDPQTLDQLPGTRLEENDTFAFRCHPAVACFNRCCRNLNLFLYPYDVLRLKKRLGVSSDRFLEHYVDVVLRDASFFPEVLLHMSADAEKTCPFLTPPGCSVYPDRPDACRTFPLEQGVLFDAAKNEARMVTFFRPPDFCMGQHEENLDAENLGAGPGGGSVSSHDRPLGRVEAPFSARSLGGRGPGGAARQNGFHGAL